MAQERQGPHAQEDGQHDHGDKPGCVLQTSSRFANRSLRDDLLNPAPKATVKAKAANRSKKGTAGSSGGQPGGKGKEDGDVLVDSDDDCASMIDDVDEDITVFENLMSVAAPKACYGQKLRYAISVITENAFHQFVHPHIKRYCE